MGYKMLRIAKSLITILAVAAIAIGATGAYFTDRAVIVGNTFSTGVLEIRVNGQPTRAGFNYPNAVPGASVTYTFGINNFGPPWFPSGPSTLPAKDLLATVANQTGDVDLYNALTAKLYANAGWSGCSNPGVAFVPGKGCTVYNGLLSGINQADILRATQWGAHPDLIPGNSFSMWLEVELPDTGGDQSALMGKSTMFDLNIDAYNPRITP